MKSRSLNGCYRVNGYSHKVWSDDPADRSTRQILKKENERELDEYYLDGEVPGVPGAFGEGKRRPRRERREDTDTRELRWWYRLRSMYPNVPWRD